MRYRASNGVLALALGVVFWGALVGASPGPAAGRTAAALALPAGGNWRAAPLGEALNNTADAFGVPLWIDRRVNLNAELTIRLEERPLSDLLSAIAATQGAAIAPLGPIVYVGPKESAAALPAVARAWHDEAPKAWRGQRPLAWRRLVEPRGLVSRLVAELGQELANPEAIPHDLMRAGETPPMRAADQLTLLLLGFNLRAERADSDPRRIVLTPIDYTAFAASKPQRPTPRRREPETQLQRRYTLRVVEQPLGPLLKQLAQRLGRVVNLDEIAGERLKQRVSFEVRQATLEELMRAVGDAAGLDVRATPDEIVVRPRTEESDPR